MNHDNLPDDCPTREGEECPVVEEHKRNHRRSTDRMPASAMRIILALIGALHGWLAARNSRTATR